MHAGWFESSDFMIIAMAAALTQTSSGAFVPQASNQKVWESLS